MSSDTTATRWTLRDLPVAARVTIGVFLVSVGIGYVSALINMHFQIASPGEAMPTLPGSTSARVVKAGVWRMACRLRRKSFQVGPSSAAVSSARLSA